MSTNSSNPKNTINHYTIPSHTHTKIACRVCTREFVSLKGLNVHISNNKICMLNTISDDTLTFDPLHKIPPTSHTNEYSDSTLEQDITYFNQYQHEGNPKIGDGIIEEQKSSSLKESEELKKMILMISLDIKIMNQTTMNTATMKVFLRRNHALVPY
jgi:hypothetical protein